jgi:hypothetical protein
MDRLQHHRRSRLYRTQIRAFPIHGNEATRSMQSSLHRSGSRVDSKTISRHNHTQALRHRARYSKCHGYLCQASGLPPAKLRHRPRTLSCHRATSSRHSMCPAERWPWSTRARLGSQAHQSRQRRHSRPLRWLRSTSPGSRVLTKRL